MLKVALFVDRNGMLNATSRDPIRGTAWQGPYTIGNARLVPGSRVAICQPNDTTFIALMVDAIGVLNVASLDVSTSDGWQGPDTVGSASLIPGCPVAICQPTSSLVTALMINRDGVLNVASLDMKSGKGWQGPDTVGGMGLVPGSVVTIFGASTSVFTAFMVDRNGVLNAAALDVSAGTGWQAPNTVGNSYLVPGSHVAAL